MKGPPPKPGRTRQRRNRASTSALLPSAEDSADRTVPPLPPRATATERVQRGTISKGSGGKGGGSRSSIKFEKIMQEWHPRVVEWWTAIWTSPMAEEYLGADVHGGLYLLAELHQRRWTETQTSVLVGLAAEIRQQEVRFGLSPIDRRRLQWEIEKGETADDKTQRRKQKRKLATARRRDPRQVLKVVK